MELLERIRSNQKIRSLLEEVCDLVISDELEQPETLEGRLSWSMSGQTFALTGDGSQYLLLADGTVGFWSMDGNVGRVAENLEEFFTLVICCGNWQTYTVRPAGAEPMWFQDYEALRRFIEERRILAERSMDRSFPGISRWLSSELQLPICGDLPEVVARFYTTTMRTPQFTATIREEDGTLTPAPGLLAELCGDQSFPPVQMPGLHDGPSEPERAALAAAYGLTPPTESF